MILWNEHKFFIDLELISGYVHFGLYDGSYRLRICVKLKCSNVRLKI